MRHCSTAPRHRIIGAGALISSGKRFLTRSLVVGAPAKVVRELTEDEEQSVLDNSSIYVKRIDSYNSLEHI
ncbi:hypothetical protein [Marinobacter sp. ELB17]|uniref:hypothetical protein n=1 Tax=Marinobacter sp. ELB17 TaxID=270374 RepID=UPI0000F37F3C|nr:hypothetical protein [Marinobacter sp. ELB17]EBA00069.1 transferase hexapeptide repeat [Marinobacter sp. ELB17]